MACDTLGHLGRKGRFRNLIGKIKKLRGEKYGGKFSMEKRDWGSPKFTLILKIKDGRRLI